MSTLVRVFLLLGFLSLVHGSALSQTDDACGDRGGSIWLSSKVVYGHVSLIGGENTRRPPKVTVTLMNASRMTASTTLDKTGNYCFQDVDGSGGTLVVEVEGQEVGREVLPSGSSISPKQFRQDFEVQLNRSAATKPGVLSAKYKYSRIPENEELFEEADTALNQNDNKKAEDLFKKIVARDPADYIVWTKLGGIYFEKGEWSGADKAFVKALELRPDLGPAMINLGRVYLMQQRFESAIAILRKSTEADPNSARSYQLLGESYLLAKQGTLAVEALNEAIRLEPIGMAECHLLMATLYDRAGAKNFASREYKTFLEKVPNHPDAKKFARYIKDHPDNP